MSDEESLQVPDGANMDHADIVKLRADYAWKWFSFHATQRTTVFNFFLVSVGILAAAYGTLLANHQNLAAVFICALAIVNVIAFMGLDTRNRKLVKFGEDALKDLEHEVLFQGKKVKQSILLRDELAVDKYGDSDEDIKKTVEGIRKEVLPRNDEREPWRIVADFLTGRSLLRWMVRSVVKHSFIIRLFQVVIALFFLALFYVARTMPAGTLPTTNAVAAGTSTSH